MTPTEKFRAGVAIYVVTAVLLLYVDRDEHEVYEADGTRITAEARAGVGSGRSRE